MSNPVLDRVSGNIEYTPAATEPVTVDGVVVKTAALSALTFGFAGVGWFVPVPGVVAAAFIAAFILAIVAGFKPFTAKYIGPLYAILQGYAVGVVSRIYDAAYNGLALTALMLTGAVFAAMLGAYATRMVRVTDKMRSTVLIATAGIAIYYLVSLVARFFGVTFPLIWSNGPFGIIFSLAVSALAAWNLLLDFDRIERHARRGADVRYEWSLAFGVVVTVVWLYIELLRLLGKLRSR